MRFLPHFGLFAISLALSLSLCGCGQKGPLYLRDKPPAGVKPERPAPYKPVPYPPDEPRDGQ